MASPPRLPANTNNGNVKRIQTHRLSSRSLQELLVSKSLVSTQRIATTRQIGEEVLGGSRSMESPNFTTASPRDLERMAEMYDVLFFESRLLKLARSHGIKFRWSTRMTSAGGKTIRTGHVDRETGKLRHQYEIALSAPLLFQTFRDLDRPIRVTGLTCSNRLQAMQRVLEHELIHLAEMLVWNDSCCAASRFQGIASRLFGHTQHKHELVTQQERAAKKFNIRIGATVAFAFDGKRYIGKVNRITRRATVLVQDPTGVTFSDGRKYRKYYVPLTSLKAV